MATTDLLPIVVSRVTGMLFLLLTEELGERVVAREPLLVERLASNTSSHNRLRPEEFTAEESLGQ